MNFISSIAIASFWTVLYVNFDSGVFLSLFWKKVSVSWILFRALTLFHFEQDYVNIDSRVVLGLFFEKLSVSWILFRALTLLHFEGDYIQIWLYLHFDWFWSKVLKLCCASKGSTKAPQLLLLGLPWIGFRCAARFNTFTYTSRGQTDRGIPVDLLV